MVWTADFKGQFRLGGGPYCYPLTVVDSYSRFLLACRALHATDSRSTIAVFRELFQEYGLPRALRRERRYRCAARAAGRTLERAREKQQWSTVRLAHAGL